MIMPTATKKTTSAGPLRLVEEDRIEVYELQAANGRVVIITRNLENGEQTEQWTDRYQLTVPDDGS